MSQSRAGFPEKNYTPPTTVNRAKFLKKIATPASADYQTKN